MIHLPQVTLSLVVLCAGTAVTAAGDVSMTFLGMLLAAGSASTEAVRLVLTQYACAPACPLLIADWLIG